MDKWEFAHVIFMDRGPRSVIIQRPNFLEEETSGPAALTDALNKLGNDGWRLQSITAGEHGVRYYLFERLEK
jgi:hypothetical protein